MTKENKEEVNLGNCNEIIARYDGFERRSYEGVVNWYDKKGRKYAKLPRYDKSLDRQVPVWGKLGIEVIRSYPLSRPVRFTISKHINQDDTKAWHGRGGTIAQAAALATAKAIQELKQITEREE
mgnify:CR=1 FL=1